MNPTLTTLVYLLAAAGFIVGLRRLQHPATARQGNLLAAGGMLLAIVVTLFDRQIIGYGALAAGLAVGAAVGVVAARKVAMTAMPEMVAAFNGFGGGASALVAAAEFAGPASPPLTTMVTILLSTAIGAVTFSGSFVALGKLRGFVPGRPITYPGQQVVNGLIAAGVAGLGVWALAAGLPGPYWALGLLTLIVGVLMVLPIGGADMPVVISLLNSFSGLAAAMAGFVITNNALIIGGSLVGAAGLILTEQMCRAMNRSLVNVVFGAFGTEGAVATAEAEERGVRTTTVEDVAINLAYADSVVVVPGYGLAVAQAQYAAAELAEVLEERGVKVRYAIHPVAGRMPGHMNVLLAEADVPYDKLFDLDEINADFPHTDVALVVGANDVVNPSARDEPGSPIYGMPILEVDKAATAVVIKRSLSPGFAGIDNPLFYRDKTLMLFSDAKEALTELVRAVKDV